MQRIYLIRLIQAKHLRRYLPWVDSSKSVADTREFIENSKNQYAANKGLDAGIWYKGEFAGVIGFLHKS